MKNIFTFSIFIDSLLLGIGLAMDAFSVSVTNGLNEPDMSRKKHFGIAGAFAFFQFFMPVIGWFSVHNLIGLFSSFQKFIPWIAFGLLGYIGGKMVYEGIKGDDGEEDCITRLGKKMLVVQGIATSIDALSVGFTIADFRFLTAFLSACIIALVTYILCYMGVIVGKKMGKVFNGKAMLLGGCILIFIGIKILVESFMK